MMYNSFHKPHYNAGRVYEVNVDNKGGKTSNLTHSNKRVALV